ncbi:MAG TPA: MBL fold metallo-hydrolase [Vicinamibacterales bacterium]|jgi:glyoxylase-like metal-dependent hydrolase (beta-lactamase superfamily II)
MKVQALARNTRLYSSNVFLVTGDWNRLEDVNGLVDAGADPAVMTFLADAATGVGKRKLDIVVLTHRHFDHATMVPMLRKAYAPTIAAFGPGDDVDRALADGDVIRLGDEDFEVIQTPGHTEDSICLYGQRSGALFAGDTPLVHLSPDGDYESGYVNALRRIVEKPVKTIYFGHGDPLTADCRAQLHASLLVAERYRRSAR